MKAFRRTLILALLCCALCLSAALADAIIYETNGQWIDDAESVNYEVYIASTGININLREGPGSDYAILATIPNFARVQVWLEYEGWGSVDYLSDDGRAYNGWIYLDHTLAELPISDADSYVEISTGEANLREGPATAYAKLRSEPIPRGEVLHVTKLCSHERCDHAWGYVTYEGVSGWVCLSETVEAAEPTPTPTPTAEPTPAAPSEEPKPSPEPTPAAEPAPAAEPTPAPAATPESAPRGDGMSSTVAVLIAVIVLLCAGVVVLVVKLRRK